MKISPRLAGGVVFWPLNVCTLGNLFRVLKPAPQHSISVKRIVMNGQPSQYIARDRVKNNMIETWMKNAHEHVHSCSAGR